MSERCVVVLSQDPRFVALIRTLLDEAGLAVRATGSVSRTLELLRTCRPDAVLIDLSVREPALCWEVLDVLNANSTPTPRIVCAAAGWLLEGHADALKRDSVAVWAEPFDPGDLLDRVRAAQPAA